MKNRSASPSLIREINDSIVLGLLLEHGPMTRTTIRKLTGLSAPSVSVLVRRLEARGLVEEAGLVNTGPGPDARIYRINSTAGYAVGIHVEPARTTAALASLTGEVVSTHTVQVPSRRATDPQTEVAEAVSGMLHGTGVEQDEIQHIVIATPGVIDPASGALRHARQLYGWEKPGLRESLASLLGVPVRHGNDVNLAAVAEGVAGAARQQSDYALLWLDQGVGVGLILGGEVRIGAHGGAGEIGYLPDLSRQGLRRVDRGATGSFQSLAGGQGITALAKEYGITGKDPVELVRHAAQDYEQAHAGGVPRETSGGSMLDEFAMRVAAGAAAITSVVDPDAIYLAGPVATAAGPKFAELVAAHLRAIAFVRPVIAASTIDGPAVLMGAIEVALRETRAALFGQPAVGTGSVSSR